VKSKKLKTIDLYAGIGGIRLGFELAGGFKTVFANDFEPACKITYDNYFGNNPGLTVGDIGDFINDPSSIPDFDFLLAGFPCQPFSVAGFRKGFKDEDRGNQFFNIIKILQTKIDQGKKPKGFLLENVKNLEGHDSGNTFRVIEEYLQSLGYTIKSEVLNSMSYGNVPQTRERIYIVGFSNPAWTKKFKFPDPIPLKLRPKDLLEKKVDAKYYYNEKPLFDKLKKEVVSSDTVYQWRRHYVRENKKGVCPTLTANMGTGGHNVPIIKDRKGIRKLTPNECLRFQGYPDDYRFPTELNDSRLYKQAGNSVTVKVIERIARNIKKAMTK
jgi:DNA (cytosine-5)-methyltransferase 1